MHAFDLVVLLLSLVAKVEDCRSPAVLVSSCYKLSRSKTASPSTILIEHCCLMTKGNRWEIVVKCRPLLSHCDNLPNIWRNVKEVYPDAKVEEKHNDIEVTLPSLGEDVEVAAFGTPGKDDQIRMQMAIFGRRPTHGNDWRIRIYLLHDTITAVKVIHCTKTCHIWGSDTLQLLKWSGIAKNIWGNAGRIKTFTSKISIYLP